MLFSMRLHKNSRCSLWNIPLHSTTLPQFTVVLILLGLKNNLLTKYVLYCLLANLWFFSLLFQMHWNFDMYIRTRVDTSPTVLPWRKMNKQLWGFLGFMLVLFILGENFKSYTPVVSTIIFFNMFVCSKKVTINYVMTLPLHSNPIRLFW